MKVLFVSSGRQGDTNPIIKNQGESLLRAGVELEYFVVAGRGWKSYVKSIMPLRKRIKEGGFDVIHAHYSWSAYLTGIASIGLRVPMIVSLMGNDILDYWWYPVLARIVAVCKPWRAVIVKSQEMRKRVGIERAIVVPNGVNMERFCELSKNECRNKIGWEEDKLHVLFPARKEDTRKNWSLAEAAIKRIINEKLVGSNVDIKLHEMNGVKNEDTPILYNAADVVVLPSFYEGSPNAVKEAMACNCPIVTTDMGDCHERIEGVEGCYVANSYDVDEFAQLIAKAFAYGKKTKGRERLIADGIADWQIAERLISIYKESKR